MQNLSNPPRDPYNFFWFVCCLIGVGLLFPFNALITPSDFWNQEFENYNPTYWLTVSYNLTQILTTLLTVKFGPKVNLTLRLVVGFALNTIFFVIISITVFVNVSEKVGFWCLMVNTFLLGNVSTILFTSSMGFVAYFPPEYTTALMSGNGVAGVIAGLIRILSVVAIPDPKTSAMIYFICAAVLNVFCVVFYLISLQTDFARYYIDKNKPVSISTINKDEETNQGLLSESQVTIQKKKSSLWEIEKKILYPGLSVFSVFFVTLALFPSIIVLIKSQAHSVYATKWFTLILIFIFQVGDLIGRTLPKWVLLFGPRWLWLHVLYRLVFFPLFILMALGRVFKNDAWPFVFDFLFAITNGYTGTLSMIYGPSYAEDHDQEDAGSLMSFHLSLGIFLGTAFSILPFYLINKSFPWQ